MKTPLERLHDAASQVCPVLPPKALRHYLATLKEVAELPYSTVCGLRHARVAREILDL